MDIIEYVKQHITLTVDRFEKTFVCVPQDKLTFSPSKTSKNCLEIGGHVVLTNLGFAKMISGEPSKFSSLNELLSFMATEEKKFTSQESVLKGLNESKTALLQALNSLTPEKLTKEIHSVVGVMPLQELILRIAPHIQMHSAQVDYIQTIWGDVDPHF